MYNGVWYNKIRMRCSKEKDVFRWNKIRSICAKMRVRVCNMISWVIWYSPNWKRNGNAKLKINWNTNSGKESCALTKCGKTITQVVYGQLNWKFFYEKRSTWSENLIIYDEFDCAMKIGWCYSKGLLYSHLPNENGLLNFSVVQGRVGKVQKPIVVDVTCNKLILKINEIMLLSPPKMNLPIQFRSIENESYGS